QRQLVTFLFHSLPEYDAVATPAVLAAAWVADFNAAFADSPRHQRLFGRNEAWNDPVISSLGTQPYRRQHITGLLMISACALDPAGQTAPLFADIDGGWEQVRTALFEQGLVDIRSTLAERLRRQIVQRTEIRTLKNNRQRSKAIEEHLGRQMRGAIGGLKSLL